MQYRKRSKDLIPLQLDSKTIVMRKPGTSEEKIINDFKNRDKETRGRKFNGKTIMRG